MSKLLLTLFVCLASLLPSVGLAADTVLDLRPTSVTTLGGSRTLYVFAIVGDIQNATSGAMDEVPNSLTCTQDFAIGKCREHCEDSIYCKGNWLSTGSLVLRNLAYELTGQWTKIRWEGFDGTEGYPSEALGTQNPTGPEGPSKPDFVIAVGDLQDQGDAQGLATLYANIPASIRDEGERYWANFVSIFDAAGVPFISARGNHDAPAIFQRYFSDTRAQSKSWHSAGNEVQHQFAIKVTMGDGKKICIMSVECAGGATALTEADSYVGCGASLPTIVVGHQVLDRTTLKDESNSTGQVACQELTTRHWYNDLVNKAANNEIIGLVGGHYVAGAANALSANSPSNFAGGEDIFLAFENLQESYRALHEVSTEPGGYERFGTTEKSGGVVVYRSCVIDPTNSTISCRDWSNYWRRGTSQNDVFSPNTTFPTTTVTFAPTWLTRFP